MSQSIFELVGGIITTAVIMAGMSSSVDVSAFKERLKEPYGIAVGVISQYILLPLTGLLMVYIFDLSRLYGVSLAVLSTMPGGSISNFWCFVCGADLNLSVACTAASTLLSVVFIPINLAIYVGLIIDPKGTIKIDWVNLTITIIALYFGLGCGLYLSWFVKNKPDHQWHKRMELFKEYLIKGVSILIICSLTYIIVQNLLSAAGLRSASATVVFASICLSVFGFCFGSSFSKLAGLPLAGLIAVGIETSNQNVVTAGVILRLSIEDKDDVESSTAILIVYALFNTVALGTLASSIFYFDLIPPNPNDDTLSLRDILRQKEQKKRETMALEEAKKVNSASDQTGMDSPSSGKAESTNERSEGENDCGSERSGLTGQVSTNPESGQSAGKEVITVNVSPKGSSQAGSGIAGATFTTGEERTETHSGETPLVAVRDSAVIKAFDVITE